jgi:hypothetical protein
VPYLFQKRKEKKKRNFLIHINIDVYCSKGSAKIGLVCF